MFDDEQISKKTTNFSSLIISSMACVIVAPERLQTLFLFLEHEPLVLGMPPYDFRSTNKRALILNGDCFHPR
jgi:hypothetical protein